MREIDAQAPEPLDELIARAAWCVARRARSMLGGVYGRRVVVIAGPGNNGADGRVAAELLSSWGVRVEVVAPDVDQLPIADLVIDGAYGTGTNRNYRPARPADGTPVLAIDIPSGVSGLTGESMGSPLTASHTVTFAAYKPGVLLPPGGDLAGTVELVDIGLDASSATAWLFTSDDAAQWLPRRPTTAHKWKQATWVVGGSGGMHGAPLLASQAALRAGSGMVWCGLPGQPLPAVASEVVFRPLPSDGWAQQLVDDGARFGSFVIGPGLGRSSEAVHNVRAAVDALAAPVVLDGDALHLLGQNPALPETVVLTPHDGEYEALTGHRPQPDRFEAARELAAATGATALLKGPVTIVARPDGRCLASISGDQRLATAGTGDVLAGLVGSYLAAGLPSDIAAALGAYMHGASSRRQTAVGMVASDLLNGVRDVAHELMTSPSKEPANAAN